MTREEMLDTKNKLEAAGFYQAWVDGRCENGFPESDNYIISVEADLFAVIIDD